MSLRSLPKYLRIAACLEREINRGKWKPSVCLPAERVMAKKFGVSHITLRNALMVLMQRGLISREHGRGTFVLDPLRDRAATRNIMLVGQSGEKSRYLRDPYYSLLLRGVEQELMKRGLDLIIRMKHDRSLGALLNDKTRSDGLLITGYNSRIKSETRELIRQNIPFVIVGRSPSDQSLPFVDSDKEGGGCLAAQWLLKRGCQRIAFLVSSRRLTFQQRLRGYRSALISGGVGLNKWLVKIVSPQMGDCRQAVRDFFVSRAPDGLILNLPLDMTKVVLEEWRALTERQGRPLPFVGFNDPGHIYSRSVLPGAFIQSPLEEIGQRATAILIDRIERRVAGPEQQVLPVRLVECRGDRIGLAHKQNKKITKTSSVKCLK